MNATSEYGVPQVVSHIQQTDGTTAQLHVGTPVGYTCVYVPWCNITKKNYDSSAGVGEYLTRDERQIYSNRS